MTRRFVYLCFVCLAPLFAQFVPPCPGSPGSPDVAQGLTALKQAKYAEAAEHFESAVAMDASCTNARLYLATSYMNQYIPGSESPQNLQLADKARGQFEGVLAQQPENEEALSAMASLYFNQKKLDEAKAWYEKLTLVNHDNKEAFYTLGVIAWARSFTPRMEARSKLGMKPEDSGPLKDAEARSALRAKYLPVIQEGMDNLNRALEIDAEYDDAMAYLNLMYREKADLDNSPEDYQADTAKADEWAEKCLEVKKSKAQRKR